MKKYQIIYADPPWNYSVMGDVHGGRGQNKQYETMRYTEICELPIQDIADDNCAIFLWATYPMLPEAMYLLRAWGFRYKTVAFTWVKLNRKALSPFFGMGQWTRTNAEIVLLGTKGKPKRESKAVSQIIFGVIEEHSKKPDEVRGKIVELMGDIPRVELFARKRYGGWDAWGNEVKSDIVFEDI